MIIQEIQIIKNKEYRYTYSDLGKLLLQKETGIIYYDALDVIESNYTYEEIDAPQQDV